MPGKPAGSAPAPLGPGLPNFKRARLGDVTEVAIGGQHRQFVANAQLRQQRVDRANLNSASTAPVSQLGRFDMVVATGNEERQRREAIEERTAGPRPGKS